MAALSKLTDNIFYKKNCYNKHNIYTSSNYMVQTGCAGRYICTSVQCMEFIICNKLSANITSVY